MKQCKVDGCSTEVDGHSAFGFCRQHYYKYKKYGDPLHATERVRDKLSQKYESEYRALKGAMQRCYNENNPSYKNYGGRGIKVADRWREKPYGFQNFMEDMGPKPAPNYSLDRIDVNGDYTPENCRWADDNVQAVNTTRTRASTFRGVRINNGYYHAYLRKDGVIHHGKYHKNEEDAIRDRIELEIKYLGKVIA